jgi:hypothetical protein
LGSHKKRPELILIPVQCFVNLPQGPVPVFRKVPCQVEVIGVMITVQKGVAIHVLLDHLGFFQDLDLTSSLSPDSRILIQNLDSFKGVRSSKRE